MADLDPVNGLRGVVHPARPTADTSWRPFTPATVTVPTARLTEWAGLLRQLSVHVPLEGPALTRALEAAQIMQWWADGHGNTPTAEETAVSDDPVTKVIAQFDELLERYRKALDRANGGYDTEETRDA